MFKNENTALISRDNHGTACQKAPLSDCDGEENSHLAIWKRCVLNHERHTPEDPKGVRRTYDYHKPPVCRLSIIVNNNEFVWHLC